MHLSFTLLNLSTQSFSVYLSKAEKENPLCCISAHISTIIVSRKKWQQACDFFPLSAVCSPAAQSWFQMDQHTTIDQSPCLHSHSLVHLSIHLFTRVLQQAVFSSEKWLKEQKKEGEREKGQGDWSKTEPYPSDTKTHSDPRNTIEQPPSTLGPGSK